MAKFKILQQVECDKCQWVMFQPNLGAENKEVFDVIQCTNPNCSNYGVEYKQPHQYVEAELLNG